MSQETVNVPSQAPARPAKSFVHHARLISILTLASRILGVLRESLAARYFGAGVVSTAFTVAFTIPNLFRRLFGEGALSAAFIPLYSQALKTGDTDAANRFAAASVNLLILCLVVITLVGELLLLALSFLPNLRADHQLAIGLTAVMLPYVLLVCGNAFLGGILQVHRHFGRTAAAPIILNLGLIGGTLLGAWLWDMNRLAGQINAVYLVSVFVILAGAVQVAILIPQLRRIGFRFDFAASLWTPQVRRMLKLSIPVAIGAGVLQLSVLLDRGIAFFLAAGRNDSGQIVTHFQLLGQTIRYPLAEGAAARLAWAQYLYQFPLGVFAIALATAIFPALSADAMEKDREKFREGLRQGIRVTLWEGLPAGIGLIIVAQLAVQVLFERGNFTPQDTAWVAQSLRFYSTALWAFSLQQIVNRAYYALHDTWTPLIMSVVGLVIELCVKIPLLWTKLGESGMAAGTAVTFSIQAIAMLLLLQRRIGNLEMGRLASYMLKLLFACGLMVLACRAVQKAPFFPQEHSRSTALPRLIILMVTGGGSYLAGCLAMGIGGIRPRMPTRK